MKYLILLLFLPVLALAQVHPLTSGSGPVGAFDQAFPAQGVPVGTTDGTYMKPLTVDANGYLKVIFQNSSLAVTGTFWQSVQPVSWTNQSISVSNFPSSQAVTGTFWQAIQPVSLGNATGKTNVMQTASKVTTATTADQVILTYTVTAGKTFYLEYLDIDARLTTFATTATYFGLTSLESPAGTKLITQMKAGAGVTVDPHYEFSEPIPIAAGTVIRVVCTPNATTSYTWQASFGGYEK